MERTRARQPCVTAALRQCAPRALPAASLLALATIGAGCEDDASLWGDAMSPTQMQRADQGSAPVGNVFTTSGGDSEDPFVDNASYPFVQGPWWSNPAYNGG